MLHFSICSIRTRLGIEYCTQYSSSNTALGSCNFARATRDTLIQVVDCRGASEVAGFEFNFRTNFSQANNHLAHGCCTGSGSRCGSCMKKENRHGAKAGARWLGRGAPGRPGQPNPIDDFPFSYFGCTILRQFHSCFDTKGAT